MRTKQQVRMRMKATHARVKGRIRRLRMSVPHAFHTGSGESCGEVTAAAQMAVCLQGLEYAVYSITHSTL